MPSNAGGPVTDYVIQYRVNVANARWLMCNDTVSTSTTANLRLRTGYTYVFRVAAKNLAGVGLFSSQSAPVTA
ncbi:MAG: fibronectin type III domain-containing protein [Betaproteobacteria bacterium]|nr:fibronectin type III domain-containing protein [Betaproteobacteria bacterium]NCA17900.1 fibronectin type III domain-containing protein [Betaproteobacteria bacterium]